MVHSLWQQAGCCLRRHVGLAFWTLEVVIPTTDGMEVQYCTKPSIEIYLRHIIPEARANRGSSTRTVEAVDAVRRSYLYVKYKSRSPRVKHAAMNIKVLPGRKVFPLLPFAPFSHSVSSHQQRIKCKLERVREKLTHLESASLCICHFWNLSTSTPLRNQETPQSHPMRPSIRSMILWTA